jgi:hypothetical protein
MVRQPISTAPSEAIAMLANGGKLEILCSIRNLVLKQSGQHANRATVVANHLRIKGGAFGAVSLGAAGDIANVSQVLQPDARCSASNSL